MIRGVLSTMNDDWQLNMWKVIKYAASVHGTREVTSYRHLQNGEVHKLTYATIYQRCCAVANTLKDFGIEHGDRVAFLAWNDHRCYELYFSVSGIGAVLLPLNFRLSQRELVYILNHSKPRGLFVDDTLLPQAEALSRDYKFEFYVIMSDKNIKDIETNLDPSYGYEELVNSHPKAYNWEEIDEKSAATACYTSGTTGQPKGVYYSHRALMLHRFIGTSIIQRFDVGDVYLQVTPMYHINGHGIYLGATMAGCKIVLPGRYTPDSLVDIIIKEKVNVACGIATLWKLISESLERVEPKPALKIRAETGGIEPPIALIKKLKEYGIELTHCWGATETDALATACFLKPELKGLPEEKQLEHAAKQGYPVFPGEIKLVDPGTDSELPWDGKSVGEVWIRGPYVIKEYYNDPRTCEQCTHDGWWRSGDLATIDELGYMKIVDRLKDVIKSGGEWISSVDLENFLMTYQYISEAAVIGVPHPKWDERPLALIVLKPEHRNMPAEKIETELTNYLLKKFTKWQLPEKFLFVEEIPKTSTGKVAKRELREHYKNIYMVFSIPLLV